MRTVDNAAQRPDAPREGLLARHPLVFYFLIAYAGTWLVTLTAALSENGVGFLPFRFPQGTLGLFIAAGAFLGPTLSAFIMTGITEGRAGIRRLLRRYVLWRVGLQWYLFALIGPPVIILLATIVLPGALASFQTLAPLDPLLLLVNFPIILIIGGPLGEEGGWRGFALPRLQRLHGPLVGTLILGVLWAPWHLPLFWVTAWGTPPTILNMALYVPAVIFMTIVFTWVFNNTKGSLLIAVLLHTSIDALVGPVGEVFPAPIVTGYGGGVPMVIGLGAAALVVVVLTRGRLGYQHYQQEEPDPATAPT